MRTNQSKSPKHEFILIGEGDVLRKFSHKPFLRNGSKVYYFHFTYTDPLTGKSKHSQISTGEREKRRATEKRDELKDSVRLMFSREGVKHSDKQPIGDFFAYFLKIKEQDGLSKKTLPDYKLRLDAFIKWSDPSLPLCNVTPDILRDFFAWIRSESTRLLTRRVLSCAFNVAVVEGKLQVNPLEKLPRWKQTEKIREYLDEPEFRKLYERQPEDNYITRTTKNAVLLAFATGMRLGEICNLKQKNIRWEKNELHIKNGDSFRTKNGNERIIPIFPRVREALQQQFQNKAQHKSELVRESQYLFANEAGNAYMKEKDKSCKLSKLFKRIAIEVYPDRPKLHFHSLRHSFGQNAYNNGMPLVQISKIMGHNSVAVTAQYYAKQRDYHNMSDIYAYLENQPMISDRTVSLGDSYS
ncbi:MAG TPA: tyrosine-type recombinase/integrase, partial [Candidatus Kapabacteria bacterium]|nr:tyrosine-type recombinase/integrase [Candidatus Kapabacteria bacterium]